MLYFYSCNVYYYDELIGRPYGVFQTASKITTLENGQIAINELTKMLFSKYKEKAKFENATFSDFEFNIVAFNPV